MQDVARLVDQELIPEQPLFYGKKFWFYTVSNGEPVDDRKQGTVMIPFAFKMTKVIGMPRTSEKQKGRTCARPESEGRADSPFLISAWPFHWHNPTGHRPRGILYRPCSQELCNCPTPHHTNSFSHALSCVSVIVPKTLVLQFFKFTCLSSFNRLWAASEQRISLISLIPVISTESGTQQGPHKDFLNE